MSGRTGPNIVRNGLIFELDAADKNSYPGAGTLWKDLSINSYNGTLTNGPTYTSANNGAIVFDGVDDLVVFSNSLISVPSSHTVMIWFFVSTMIPSAIGYANLFAADSNQGIYVYSANGVNGYINFYTAGDNLSSTQVPVNQWVHVAVVCNAGTVNYYFNGALDSNSNINGVAYNADRIGGDSSSEYLTGKIANVTVYNRALNRSEILQNYNATKGRFNLQ